MERAGDLMTMVHVADSLDHTASSGLRYIVNPPGSQVTIHQHLDIGQGEVDFDEFFSTLEKVGFDGIVTTCVFAWEERPRVEHLHARDHQRPPRAMGERTAARRPVTSAHLITHHDWSRS
jgi:myo-inositol catabolism protein IolH